MKQHVRTFVAVEIDPAVRSRAARLIDTFRSAAADVKWVDPKNMHLTVKFLGDVDVREIHQVCAAVQRATADVVPFSLEIRGAGAFPDTRRPRTIWVGVRQGLGEMTALNQRVESALEALGFPREGRAFSAHLTLGRVRRSGPELRRLAELIQQHADEDIGLVSVDQVVVFSSELTRTGPIYEATPS